MFSTKHSTLLILLHSRMYHQRQSKILCTFTYISHKLKENLSAMIVTLKGDVNESDTLDIVNDNNFERHATGTDAL